MKNKLTLKEHLFIREYLETLNGTESAIRAGYSSRSARTTASRLLAKPEIKEEIGNILSLINSRFDHSIQKILNKLLDIAICDPSELTSIIDGKVSVKDTDNMSQRAKHLFAGAEEHITAQGDVVVKVKKHNQLEALKMLLNYHNLLRSTAQAKKSPLPAQKAAITAVIEGKKSVTLACLELEKEGIQIPESLQILLKKQPVDIDSDDEGEIVIPSAEELEANRKAKLAAIEEQKQSFLPERRREVQTMKAELNHKKNW